MTPRPLPATTPVGSPAIERTLQQIDAFNRHWPNDRQKKHARLMVSSLGGAKYVRGQFGYRFRKLLGKSLAWSIEFQILDLAFERGNNPRRTPLHVPNRVIEARAVLIALRYLRRFNPEKWEMFMDRATTDWREEIPSQGKARQKFQQAAE